MSYSNLNVTLGNVIGATSNSTYAKKDKNFKEEALDFSKTQIENFEKDNYKIIDKTDLETTQNGKIDYAELIKAGKTELAESLSEYDLDGKDGLSDKEVASYLMAIDCLALENDPKYSGLDFVDGADINEDDLKKAKFDKSAIDGKIDEDSLKALEKIKIEDLQTAAKEMYDENYAKKASWFSKLFK